MKMEVDFTEEQMEKVEHLKKNGIDVGDAIDMLFDIKEVLVEGKILKATQEKAQLEEKLSKVNEEISLFTKLKDNSLDSSQKQKIVEKEFGVISESFDSTVQNAKHKFKWSKLL